MPTDADRPTWLKPHRPKRLEVAQGPADWPRSRCPGLGLRLSASSCRGTERGTSHDFGQKAEFERSQSVECGVAGFEPGKLFDITADRRGDPMPKSAIERVQLAGELAHSRCRQPA